ncbi:hypothetical protein [Synechococcus sp. M16CYN]|uniref:hypothetical protein n=1 Tax=Synechococcus sp. M16CYN TaxID=3103139 RepID=UPI00333E2261
MGQGGYLLGLTWRSKLPQTRNQIPRAVIPGRWRQGNHDVFAKGLQIRNKVRSLFRHEGGNTSAMTIQEAPIETTDRERSTLKPLIFQLGRKLRSLADSVTSSLAVQNLIYTNCRQFTRKPDQPASPFGSRGVDQAAGADQKNRVPDQ